MPSRRSAADAHAGAGTRARARGRRRNSPRGRGPFSPRVSRCGPQRRRQRRAEAMGPCVTGRAAEPSHRLLRTPHEAGYSSAVSHTSSPSRLAVPCPLPSEAPSRRSPKPHFLDRNSPMRGRPRERARAAGAQKIYARRAWADPRESRSLRRSCARTSRGSIPSFRVTHSYGYKCGDGSSARWIDRIHFPVFPHPPTTPGFRRILVNPVSAEAYIGPAFFETVRTSPPLSPRWEVCCSSPSG